jgi:hypothetical protein
MKKKEFSFTIHSPLTLQTNLLIKVKCKIQLVNRTIIYQDFDQSEDLIGNLSRDYLKKHLSTIFYQRVGKNRAQGKKILETCSIIFLTLQHVLLFL